MMNLDITFNTGKITVCHGVPEVVMWVGLAYTERPRFTATIQTYSLEGVKVYHFDGKDNVEGLSINDEPITTDKLKCKVSIPEYDALINKYLEEFT